MKRNQAQGHAAPVALSDSEAAAVAGGASYFDGRLLSARDLTGEQSASGAPLVEFAPGATGSPVVLGSLWNGTDKPPS